MAGIRSFIQDARTLWWQHAVLSPHKHLGFNYFIGFWLQNLCLALLSRDLIAPVRGEQVFPGVKLRARSPGSRSRSPLGSWRRCGPVGLEVRPAMSRVSRG